MCSDSIQFRAIGAITQPLIEWVNRPTFQQVVEITGHGPRSHDPGCLYSSATQAGSVLSRC